MAASSHGLAEDTNSLAITNAPVAPTASAPARLDEASFRLVAERNIFNANRSGTVRPTTSSRRAPRVESFKLVGVLAYEKGTVAFFEGSNSELNKALKLNAVIATHKIVEIADNSVKLESDGKVIELPIGSAMRREDDGAWHLGEAVAGSGNSSYVSSRDNGDRSSRNGWSRGDRDNDRDRSRRDDSDSERSRSAEAPASASPASGKSPADILKELMERRAKEESQ